MYSLDIQENKPLEDITVKDEATFVVLSSLVTTTTFIVSSSETSPPDLSLSVIINGGKAVPFKREASRRCVCQAFCYKEGLNCWSTTIAFFPEHLLDVSNTTSDKWVARVYLTYVLLVYQIAYLLIH